jgi:two-component system nitrate/nitrite response regulator NarL
LILRCIIEGDPNKCIARKIDIAEATVKVHVKAILRKIEFRTGRRRRFGGINNGSLTQPESGSHPPLVSDMSKRFADPIKAIGEIKQIEAPAPTHPANHNAYHVEAARIERLVRKGRRTPGTTRLGK